MCSSDLPPKVMVYVGTAFATATSATLRIQLQAAVDSGSPTYAPGTWTTIAQSADLTPTQLTANVRCLSLAIPPRLPSQALYRYFRLFYSLPVSASSFTAGTLSAYITTGVDETVNMLFPAAY